MREYKLSDSQDTLGSDRRNGGIHISTATGFILVLLAIILAVVVGLIVHFASPGRVVCTCEMPTVAPPAISSAELQQRCVVLANKKNQQICTACSDPEPSTSPVMTESSPKPEPESTTTTTAAPPTTTPAPVNYRLPSVIKPDHYILELQPEIYGTNSSAFTFNGSVAIHFTVYEATDVITLHKKDLTINEDTLVLTSLNVSQSAPSITNTSYCNVREFYFLHLDAELKTGSKYKVMMTFDGKMRTDGEGFYVSSYKDDTNQTVYLATTQFEAPLARTAFPCFDEPVMKATFDTTLVRKTDTGRDYITLTNTDTIRNETRPDGYVADVHATSPKMSTYLLAFIVCDYKRLENRTSNITYRTLARPNGIQYARPAQEYGMDLFDWFEKTFNPNYPISKLDNIAIPDFNAGAMENWGLITYRERLLQVPGVSTASHDDWTAEVIAHEIAHMWFGNIVSPKWWWWLWLNEAFASFWDFHVVDQLFPERRGTDQYVIQSMHASMAVDSSRTSHPLTTAVESNKEVEDSFDTITYSKGAGIVRMMRFIMGNDLFVKGLNLYLARHQYSVADHSDLLAALTDKSAEEGTTINMTYIMDPWVTQMNFPVVMVTVVKEGTIHVSQQRFLSNMSVNTTGDHGTHGYKWNVPITIASSADRSNLNKTYTFSDIHWLHDTETDREFNDSVIPNPSNNDSWILVNLHQTGFYRVNYEDRNWVAILNHLETDLTIIPPINRGQLINDAWTLQGAGLLKMEIALRTLNFLRHETDYVPWRGFARHIGYLDAMLERSDLYGAFRAFMVDSTKATYNRFGLDVRPEYPPINVYQLYRGAWYACQYGSTVCRDAAQQIYADWMSDADQTVNPNIRNLVYCTAVRRGGLREWNFAHRQYWDSTVDAIRTNALNALGCSSQPWLLERMLTMSLNESEFRSTHRRTVITYVARNPIGREIAWNFLKTNFAKLKTSLSRTSLSTLVRAMAYSFNTEYFLQELKDFSATDAASGFATAFRLSIETTERNIAWMADNSHVIRQWLIDRGYSSYLP